MEIQVEWEDLKSFVSDRKLSWQYVEFSHAYVVIAIDGPITLSTHIKKESPINSDQSDFETNFKSLSTSNSSYTDASGRPIQANTPFGTAENHSFKGRGISGNAVKNTTTNIDWTVPVGETYELNGVEIYNGVLGDKIQMKVMDDALGTYSGFPNAQLDEFGIDWNMHPDMFNDMPYSATVMPGMIVRFVYENNDVNNDRTIYINMHLHKAD